MADESKLQIILEAVNETGSPFKDLNEAISAFQQSADDLAKSISASFESMSKSASEAASGIEDSVKADSQAFQEIATSASEQAKLAEESLNEISKSATEMEKGISEAAAGVEKGLQSASTSANEFERTTSEDFQNASREMDNLRSNMEKGVGEIGGLIAVQMLGQSMEELGKQGEHLFDFAIEQGSDFQQTMKNIQTVIATNITTHEAWNQKLKDSSSITEQLQQKALELGSRGAQSANEVGAAMDTMLRAGVDAKTVLNGAAESAQNVAIVTGDKLDESANLVTEIYHQFRESFAENGKSVQENMKETGNVLTGTLLSARINSQDFLDTLKYVGPVASQLGSTFLDTATATAVLAQNGIKGSQAGNNLKRALTSLLEPTKAGATAMEHLGLIQHGHNMLIDQTTGKMKNLTQIQEILHKSMDGLTEAQKAKYIHDMFGQYALAGTLVLANENSEAFSKLKEKIGGISAENAAASMLDTFSGHMSQLQAHVQTTAKEFGMSFLPVLEKLIPIGQQVLNWLQSLSPSTKEFLMGILAVGSAVAIAGGALATFAISLKFANEGMEALKGIFMIQAEGEVAISVFKKFAMAVREVGLAEAFMDAMNPVAWFVLIGTAVVAVTMLIIQHWNQISSFLTTTWNEITQGLTTAWNGIKDFFSSLWQSISQTATSVWNGISSFFSQWGITLLAIFVPVLGLPLLIQQHWSQITQIANQIWNDVVNTVQNIWNGAISWITGAAQNFVNLIVNAFQWMYNHNYYFKDLVDFIKNAWNTIQTDVQAVWNAIKSWVSNLWNGIVSGAKTIWTGLSTFLTGLWNAIKSAAEAFWNREKQGFENIWNGIVSVAKTVWNGLTTFFSGLWNGISSGVSTAWNGIKSTIGTLANDAINALKGPFNTLGSFFSGLWNQAYQWGSNLINMVANGIKSAASAVTNAVKGVASSISGFLGFHSPTKEGPGSDADTWMPNMMKMFTEGIQSHVPMIQNAIGNVALGIKTGITQPITQNFSQTMTPIVSSTRGNTAPIVISIGSISGNIARNEQQLGEIVSTHIVNKMKSQGKLG